MADADEFIDALARQAEDVQSQQSDNFEDSCVQYVLSKLGAGGQVRALRAERKQQSDIAKLDFLWFYGKFTDCPVQFATARLGRAIARRRFPRDWFMSPDKLPFMTAYTEYRQLAYDNGVTSAFGVIFTWPGWQTKLLVHDWAYRRETGRTYWVSKARGRNVYVEPLDNVLSAIQEHWRPE